MLPILKAIMVSAWIKREKIQQSTTVFVYATLAALFFSATGTKARQRAQEKS
ncbi:MAG: hypothetical protein LCH47_02625 [Proteobacteria bacterium]|nr:hypothetical protein [Pseudomonadota bacterium]